MPASDPSGSGPDSANDNEGPQQRVVETATGKCPLCSKPRDPKYRPFCSKHCADVDLARWLGGRYAVPASSNPQDEEDMD